MGKVFIVYTPAVHQFWQKKGCRINVNVILSSLTKSKTKHQENLAVVVKLAGKKSTLDTRDIGKNT